MIYVCIQTLPDLGNFWAPEGSATVGTECVYLQSSWNTNSITLECDWKQHNRPAACVVAQQFISPRSSYWGFFSTAKKNSTRLSKISITYFIFFLNLCVWTCVSRGMSVHSRLWRYKIKMLVIHSNTEHNVVQVLHQTHFMMLDTFHVVVFYIITVFSEIWKSPIPILAALEVSEAWKADM